jgi:hypothetical protein
MHSALEGGDAAALTLALATATKTTVATITTANLRPIELLLIIMYRPMANAAGGAI